MGDGQPAGHSPCPGAVSGESENGKAVREDTDRTRPAICGNRHAGRAALGRGGSAIATAAGLDADLYLSYLANAPRGIGFHECTSYAVAKEFTQDHAIFFHKNRDNVDCEQAAYVLASSVTGVNKFIAITNASAVNCSMMVNDKGLAGSGDYPAHLTRKGDPHALLPEAAEPRFRGMMNDFLLRHIAERTADCSQALNVIQDFTNTLERQAHADKQRLAGQVAGLLTAKQSAEAIDLLDSWAETTANAQLAIMKGLLLHKPH